LKVSATKEAMGLVEVLIRFQTLTEFSVPAATHYNLGLKAITLMVEPASNSLEL